MEASHGKKWALKRRRVWESNDPSMEERDALTQPIVRGQDSSLWFRVGSTTSCRWRACHSRSSSIHLRSNPTQWCNFLFLFILIIALEYTEGAWSRRWLHPHEDYVAEQAMSSHPPSNSPKKQIKIRMIPPLLQDGVEVQAGEESVPTIYYIYATWPPAPHSFAPVARPPNVAPPSTLPTTTTIPPMKGPSPDPSTVSLSPTTLMASSTLDPTNAVSEPPTIAPTTTEPTFTAPTVFPSLMPQTASPTSMRPTTLVVPTKSPTNRPSTITPMTRLPVLLPPTTTTIAPTIFPSVPTQTPTTTKRTTVPPTQFPTIAPTISPTPTRQLMAKAQVSVPFTLSMIVDTADQTSLLLVWQDYLTNVLREEFGNEPGVSVDGVRLEDRITDHPRQRILAPERLVITGSADFIIDEGIVEWKDFSNRVQMVLEEATTVENLQEALTNAGDASTIVAAAPTMAPIRREESRNQRIPTNAEMVLGFAILILTVLSLFYWANILWKKREKRKRREQLEALRQQSLRNAMGQVAPLPKVPMPLQRLTSDEAHIDIPVMPDIGSLLPFPTAAITDGESSQSSHQRSPSDSFALELQKAVSLDRRAWEEYRKHKEQEAGERRNAAAYHPSIEGVEVTTSSVNTSSVTSFPYGDEEQRGTSPTLRMGSPYSSLPPIREAARHERRHQTPDVTVTKRATLEDYSPYGDSPSTQMDRHEPRSEYWDREADKIFREDDAKQAQFSFLHPLRPRDVEADIPNTEDSSNSEETPTSGAVRESIEVTSIGDIQELESKENDPMEPNDDSMDWPTSLTETMLREVEYISQFVRRYEEKRKKKTTKKSRPGELYDDSGEAVDRATLDREIIRSANRTALQPVSNSSALEEGRIQVQEKSVPRVELSEEGYRGRLGIGKFSIGRPDSNRSTRFDSKPSRAVQFRDVTSEISPIHSEDDYQPQKDLAPRQSAQITGRLSSLRSNESILDITPVGEFAADAGSVSPRQVSNDSTPPATTSAYSARRQRRQEFLEMAADAAQPRSQRKKVSPRSKNMTFNNIRSIFESKDTDPIVPPNENWQHIGSHSVTTGSSIGENFR